jgi:hypothetical protein
MEQKYQCNHDNVIITALKLNHRLGFNYVNKKIDSILDRSGGNEQFSWEIKSNPHELKVILYFRCDLNNYDDVMKRDFFLTLSSHSDDIELDSFLKLLCAEIQKDYSKL